jgi:large subunit ribosomal protein L18
MQCQVNRKEARRRIRYRVRRTVAGSAARPRLAVYRSLKHIYVQAIDDESGRTLAAASSQDPALRGALERGSNVEAAKHVGGLIARKLKDAGVESVVFDRGGVLYHGRVKALAEAAREGGLKF